MGLFRDLESQDAKARAMKWTVRSDRLIGSPSTPAPLQHVWAAKESACAFVHEVTRRVQLEPY